MPDVTTERLILRRFLLDDVDELAAIFAKPEVWEYPLGRGLTRPETESFVAGQIAHWETCGVGCWVGFARESGRMLGYVGLSVPTFLPEVLPVLEVGWRFDPGVWGNGYATEGAQAALLHAFVTLELPHVCSLLQADNLASVRLAHRLGLSHQRDTSAPATERRGPLIVSLYSITADEWLART
jgi:RimJ/RimL family protein N-acetyltransferase